MDSNFSNQIQYIGIPGVLYSHIPHHLSISDKPELNMFPLNVMFSRFHRKNPSADGGKIIMGSALYEPALNSYRKKGTRLSMEYFNIYGSGCWLIIEYDSLNASYHGKKFIRGTCVGQSFGREWKWFFVHFTALGLSDGERCKFDEITDKKSN
jgi:hypothetical protein